MIDKEMCPEPKIQESDFWRLQKAYNDLYLKSNHLEQENTSLKATIEEVKKYCNEALATNSWGVNGYVFDAILNLIDKESNSK